MNPEQAVFLTTAGFAQFVGTVWLMLDGEPRGPDLARKFLIMECVVIGLGLLMSYLLFVAEGS